MAGATKKLSKTKDLTGKKFGYLTALCPATPSIVIDKQGYKHKKTKWLCQCECGNVVEIYSVYLLNGDTKSCGCKTLEMIKKNNRKHNNFVIDESNSYFVDSKGVRFYSDSEDYDKISEHFWYQNIGGYATTTLPNGKQIMLHKFLTNTDSSVIIDHIDRNKCNNRKNNLRPCTNEQNLRNASKGKRNNSGYIGVCFSKERNKWEANICYKRKHISLGRFVNKEDAIKARLKAELKYFGKDFAPQRHLFKQYGITND